MQKTQVMASLTLDAAQFLAQKAIDKAVENGFLMNVVVVDRSGNLLVALRMPGAPLPARDFAEKKAYTAVNFALSTSAWKERLADRPVVMVGLSQHPKVALFGGGEPVFLNGEVVGAIGVAGGKETDDILCAQYALNEFDKL